MQLTKEQWIKLAPILDWSIRYDHREDEYWATQYDGMWVKDIDDLNFTDEEALVLLRNLTKVYKEDQLKVVLESHPAGLGWCCSIVYNYQPYEFVASELWGSTIAEAVSEAVLKYLESRRN